MNGPLRSHVCVHLEVGCIFRYFFCIFQLSIYLIVDNRIYTFFPLILVDDSSMQRFVKLLSATPTETLELITSPERVELEGQLSELGKDNASESCFVEAALEELIVCTCT